MRFFRYIYGFGLSLALACLGGFVLRAQGTAAGVAEIPVQENESPFRVLTLGKLGVLVMMEQNDLFSSTPQRSLYFYDENLHKRWQSDLAIESRFHYAGQRVEEDSLRFALVAVSDKKGGPELCELALSIADG